VNSLCGERTLVWKEWSELASSRVAIRIRNSIFLQGYKGCRTTLFSFLLSSVLLPVFFTTLVTTNTCRNIGEIKLQIFCNMCAIIGQMYRVCYYSYLTSDKIEKKNWHQFIRIKMNIVYVW
jgi:hypothetical protein